MIESEDGVVEITDICKAKQTKPPPLLQMKDM